MVYGLVHIPDDLYCQDKVMEFHAQIVLCQGNGMLSQQGQGSWTGVEDYARIAKLFAYLRQNAFCHVLMDEHAFQGIADAWPLHLAVEDNVYGHVCVGTVVYVGMAHAFVVLEHRHGGCLCH